MSAPDAPVADRMIAGSTAAAQWTQIHAVAPQIVSTTQRYLQRLAAFQAPASVDVAGKSLRPFAPGVLSAGRPAVTRPAGIAPPLRKQVMRIPE